MLALNILCSGLNKRSHNCALLILGWIPSGTTDVGPT